MKIALIGYGKMGKTIEQIAIQRGHQIVSIIDINNAEDIYSEAFKSADAAIEFTTPATAFNNYMKCFEVGVPVVSGTTGWLDRIGEIKEKCEKEGKTFFYASNFSIGVNIFFAMNKYLAKIMNNFPSYDVKMTEVHHIHKLDAPSGTAITLAEGILENIDRKDRWTLSNGRFIGLVPQKCDFERILAVCHAIDADRPPVSRGVILLLLRLRNRRHLDDRTRNALSRFGIHQRGMHCSAALGAGTQHDG